MPEHFDGLPEGWEHWLKRIEELAERLPQHEAVNVQPVKQSNFRELVSYPPSDNARKGRRLER